LLTAASQLSIRESAVAAFGFKADTATLQLDVVRFLPSLSFRAAQPAGDALTHRSPARFQVDREEVTADFIELFFKDQYIGRSDMWRLGCSLEDSCIYMGQEVRPSGQKGTRKTIV
jgi:hypothetical protein